MPEKIDLLTFEKDIQKRSMEKWEDIFSLFSMFVIPMILYYIFCRVISEFNCSLAFSVFLSLLGYIFLLLSIPWVMKCYKRFVSREIPLQTNELVALFCFYLLFSAIIFIEEGILKNKDIWIYAALTNLLLYIGFTVSLDDLFNMKRYRELLNSLIKPFWGIGLNKKKMIMINHLLFL